jgi:hypothetical protein
LRLRCDLWADDRDLGDRLQCPPWRLDPAGGGGDARPVALAARGRADEHVARGRVAVVGGSGFAGPVLGAGGLEELDRVPRGVLEQYLAAAPPRDDLVTEASPSLAQHFDVALEV